MGEEQASHQLQRHDARGVPESFLQRPSGVILSLKRDFPLFMEATDHTALDSWTRKIQAGPSFLFPSSSSRLRLCWLSLPRAMARLEVAESRWGSSSLATSTARTPSRQPPTSLSAALTPPGHYPRTTWMQEILTFIHSQGDPKPAKTIPNWARFPWLEHTYFAKTLQETSGPRLLTSHLPHAALDGALRKGQPKVIYLARHPKDVAVSYYHFYRMANFFPDPGSFDEFLQSFLDGTVHYGSWFDHVKGWLSCQGESGIAYLTYEELHQDLEGSIERLCAFLGHPVKPDLTDSIRKHCSFASMSQNDMVNGALVPQEILDTSKSQFMRKGIVGDWKNHFSPLQSALFSKKYQEEMGGLDLPFKWVMD
ncbi:sulfotransferase 2B1-like [Sceloporus undulatus]|uniref:sulfotransferase 2B1-like n=1 Tax=Sceloporus undulatus TaxID=8520 RepID=UPI001C4A7FD8|nr:sulfotransferase 2B1-like [Sceloporus undulatus]